MAPQDLSARAAWVGTSHSTGTPRLSREPVLALYKFIGTPGALSIGENHSHHHRYPTHHNIPPQNVYFFNFSVAASSSDVKIIGDKQKPKHDLPTGSSRTSITIYRVGSTAGVTGPTAFLPPGKQRKTAYNDAFLVNHGAPAGSIIAMTPTGYMTEDAWLEIAPSIAGGIRH